MKQCNSGLTCRWFTALSCQQPGGQAVRPRGRPSFQIDVRDFHGCYVQRQCGNLLKWRRGRKCEHGTMAGYEDAMSNIFASLFLFLLSDSRKTSDCLKFSWLPSFEQYQDVPCRSKNAGLIMTISGLRWSPKHFVITLLP